MPKVKLSEDFLKTSLTCPEDKRRIEYTDGAGRDAVPGLYVEVRNTSPGQGTFYLRHRDPNGKTCHAKLGRTIDIDLATAREKAKKLRAQIALGIYPNADKKEVLTFTTFFEDHYLPYARQRKRTWRRDRELFDLRLKDQFGRKNLTQITRAQIQTFHTGLRNEGLAGATCDHQVKLLRRCLNLAVEWGMLEKNPASGFAIFNEPNAVERYLNDDELRRLLVVLHNDRNKAVCNIALWLLSTGARLNEALRARWDHIDRDNWVWRIPAITAKAKRVRSVPLNDSALAILDALDTEDDFDYLFINRKTGRPYTTIHKVWERIRAEAELPHLRIHDLRHSYASFLVNSGRSLYEIQQILGHSQPQVTQRYSHLSTKSLQDAANTASIIINGASRRET